MFLNGGFLIAVFTALFVAPLVLGGFIIAQNARRSVVMGWFTFGTLCFLLVLLVAIGFLVSVPV